MNTKTLISWKLPQARLSWSSLLSSPQPVLFCVNLQHEKFKLAIYFIWLHSQISPQPRSKETSLQSRNYSKVRVQNKFTVQRNTAKNQIHYFTLYKIGENFKRFNKSSLLKNAMSLNSKEINKNIFFNLLYLKKSNFICVEHQ